MLGTNPQIFICKLTWPANLQVFEKMARLDAILRHALQDYMFSGTNIAVDEAIQYSWTEHLSV